MRGGLGRVKGAQQTPWGSSGKILTTYADDLQMTLVLLPGQGFFLSAKTKWATSSDLALQAECLCAFRALPTQEPAGSDPLYKRFTRGPVLGEAKAASPQQTVQGCAVLLSRESYTLM